MTQLSNIYSFLLIVLCSVTAVWLVPNDVDVEDALLWSSWSIAAGLLISIALDTSMNGIVALVRSVNIVFAGVLVVLLAEPLQPGYVVNLTRGIIEDEFATIGIFLASVILGSALPCPTIPQRLQRLASTHYPTKRVRALIVTCFVFGMLNFAIASGFSPSTMVGGLFSPRFEAPWTRGALGSWDAFRDFLNYCGYPLPTLCVLLAHYRKKWNSSDVIGSILMTSVFLAFLAQGGGRRVLVVVIGAAIIAFFLINLSKMRLRHFAAVTAAVIVTAGILDLVLQVRNQGFGDALEEEIKIQTRLRVDDNFWSLGEVVKAIPNEHPYVGWGNILYVAVRPIPRVFWPDKPVDPGFDLATHLGANSVIFSTTALGECYFSYGWTGVGIGGMLFGVAARTWTSLLRKDTSPIGYCLYGLGAMALFLGIRSFIDLVLMMYPIALWLVWDVFTDRKVRV